MPNSMANPLTVMHDTSNAQNISDLLAQLPKGKWLGEYDVYEWEGSWYPPLAIESSIAFQAHFKARDDDIILASSPKSGTTWLKALVSSIVRGEDELVNNDKGDPLLAKNPHSIVKTIEWDFNLNQTPDLSDIPSPRIFHSHLPYLSLPDSVKNSACKIVYVARNPKDTLASWYHFMNTFTTPEKGPYSIDQAFENFCKGVHPYGPHLDHVLEYWNQSLLNPDKVRFLKYEELKREPKEHVKKLAEFLDKPFSKDEGIDQVIWRCSLERLKNLEVNKSGSLFPGWSNSKYFRRGAVGDWKNSLTEEMSKQLDQLTHSKLQESGLDYSI